MRYRHMTLEEYTKNLHQDVLCRAEDSPNYAVDLFTEEAIGAITETGEAEGAFLCNCRRRGFKVNAFNLSANGDCVDLFVTLYNNQDPPPRVTKSEIERHFTWLQGFFSRCLSENFPAGLGPSFPEAPFET
jgi:Abortive infection phage resistance protein N-terminal domain